MKRKKPGRFERLVKRLAEYENLTSNEAWITCESVVKLLRKEHKAVVRMVKQEFKVWATTSPKGYASAPALRHERAKQCRDILDRLTRRAT